MKSTYLYIVPIPPPFVVIMILVVKLMASSFGWRASNFATSAATFSDAGVNSLPPLNSYSYSFYKYLSNLQKQ